MVEPERNSGIHTKCVASKNDRNDREDVKKGSVKMSNNEHQKKADSPKKSNELISIVCENKVGVGLPAIKASSSSKINTEIASGDRSPALGQHTLTKSKSVKPSEIEKVFPKNAPASSLLSSSSIDSNGVSSVIDNTIDCSEGTKNGTIEMRKSNSKFVPSCPQRLQQTDAISTSPPSHQSQQCRNESVLYDDNEQTSQAPMVVAVPQQQTVYYQIPRLPSVVTLPVEASQDVVQKDDGIDQHERIEQQQMQYTNHHQIDVSHSHLPMQTDDQIIGMVGAIPIIKMQAGGMHYVKKKKGRFNLLHDTPVIPNVLGLTPMASHSSQTQGEISRHNTVAPIQNIPSSRSQSPMAINTSGSIVPQTFDGKSAPTVKRKGRFVVTNVKDPGSIIQIKTKSTSGVAVITSTDNNATSSQQEQQQHNNDNQPTSIHHQRVSPLQPPLQNRPIPIMQQTFQQSDVSQIPLQPVMIQPVSTIQQTYEIPQQYSQNYSQYSVSAAQSNRDQFSQISVHNYAQNLPPQTIQYSNVPINSQSQSQKNYVQYFPPVQHALYPPNQSTPNTYEPVSVAVPQEKQVCYNQQQQCQQQLPKQQFVPRASEIVPHHQTTPSAAYPINQQTVSQTTITSTPPSTPKGPILSPIQSRIFTNSSLPNAPVPKPPTNINLEKQQQQTKIINKKKTTIQGRSGKVPQSFDSNGTISSIGLGKVFYLLDQMKMEVTDADQCIKTLQTDIKLLRDKNKDLESKNKELDNKLREEQVLREKVEIRNMDLRKKLQEARDEIKTAKHSGKSSKVENDGSWKNTDSVADKLSNSNLDSIEAKPPSTIGKIPQKGVTATNSGVVIGASPKRHSAASDASSTAGSSHSHNTILQIAPTPLTPKTRGSSSNALHPSKNDLNLKDQSDPKNGSDGASRLNRSRHVVKEAEQRSRTSTIESSVASRSAKEKPEATHRRNESLSTTATPPLMPPLKSNTNGPRVSHRYTQSLHEFDPLKSTVPIISFPTPLSLERLPIKTSTTSESVAVPHDLRDTYISQNSVVMPLSFGMAPTTVRTTDGSVEQKPPSMPERQTLVANDYHGLHEQRFMVVPQQQPIIFNQMTGRVHQQMGESTYPTQQRTSSLQNHPYAGGALQQQYTKHQPLQRHLQHDSQQHYMQHSTQQTYTNSANPFDPFSS